ncbi:hypothetical protein ACWGMW_03015 [Streptomyces albidoflavus]|uniref:hypothetical protein n=1 Tax=Streptomyces sp. GF20 TaxID=2692235 RepID=UPI001318B7D5|nr:hypothetical protein [Streptomyces sp. GF20]QHC16875.1 hypothetical protein GR131_16265 [Streptomyces sp. GF20]
MHQQPLLVDAYAAQAATGIRPGTIRQWLRRGHLTHHGHDARGRVLIDLHELRARLALRSAAAA